MNAFGLKATSNIKIMEPVGYLDMVNAVNNAQLVQTDSGGLQEETTVLGIPCLTIRENTERPSTIDLGTNFLVGTDPEIIQMKAEEALSGKWKIGSIPPLWDGRAALRIAEHILDIAQQTV
jgi:UDP-N-acetylglucosamine 2-epimerase (non-hydrolysing)